MDGIRTFSRGCGLSPCREPGRRGLPRGQAPRVRACVCVWRKLGEGRPGGRGAGLRPEGDQAPAAPARSAPRGRGGGRATAAEPGCDPGVQAPSGKRGPHVPRLPRAAPRRRAGRSASGVLGQGSATPGLRAGGLWELGRRRIPGAERSRVGLCACKDPAGSCAELLQGPQLLRAPGRRVRPGPSACADQTLPRAQSTCGLLTPA